MSKAETLSAQAKELNVEQYRKDFPILDQEVNGKPLAYLDNAATTQKPQQVIDTLNWYYTQVNSNVHRGIHSLSQQASESYEQVRGKLQRFFNAQYKEEMVFVRGTTEGINLVAQTHGKQNVKEGDEVLITGMEHHSNIVPWQMLCEEQGATLKVADVTDEGDINLDDFEAKLSDRTKMVAFIHVSNTLGTVNPARYLVDRAHAKGAAVLIDGAQAPMHMPVDVQDLDCDFYVMSAHKIFGPTGIGILYGKYDVLDAMPPYQGGGDMIDTVTFEKTSYNEVPLKLEAGTPNIADTIAFGRAVEYVEGIGREAIQSYEKELLEYATAALRSVDGLQVIGQSSDKAAVISFVFDEIHPQDVGILLDQEGVAIRTGHHCTQPLMRRYNIPATSRASFAFYNTKEEIDQLVKAIHQVKTIFS
jgi:cysteine desulfurase/selenocysteine lyase